MKKPLSSAEASVIAAERRISDDLRQRIGGDVDRHAALLSEIDRPLMDAAVEAELKWRGSGTDHLLSSLLEKANHSDRRPAAPRTEEPL